MTGGRPRSEDFAFSADGQRLAATRILPADGRAPQVLHLHGLGPTANRHTIRYLLDPLAEAGYGSVTFEFSGNGESTGVLESSTLRGRRAETVAAAAQLDPDTAPVLIGSSMGAHLACWTAPELKPRALILFCPAAYPASMTDAKFDGTQAKPGAYDDSPAYAGIREFTGDLLVVAARDDEVVPPPVVEGYLRQAVAARSAKAVWIEDCGHFIHRRLPDQGRLKAEVLAQMLRVLRAPAASGPAREDKETAHVH